MHNELVGLNERVLHLDYMHSYYMKYIAHRGYSLTNRDNSMIAIQEAVRRQYDGVEIDVQLCKSGELVLYHNIYIDHSYVRDLTYEELRDRGVYSLHEAYLQVPELENRILVIDIKGCDLMICDALKTFFKNKSTDNVFFCSFNRNIVYNLPTSFYKGSTFETTFTSSEFELITKGLDVVILHWTCLDTRFISYCKQNSIRVFTYTHNEDMEINYMLRFDVDGIITNGFGSLKLVP